MKVQKKQDFNTFLFGSVFAAGCSRHFYLLAGKKIATANIQLICVDYLLFDFEHVN